MLITATLIWAGVRPEPPSNRLSEEKARAMAQELVDSVESDFECTFSLEYLIVGVEPYTNQDTVAVRPGGRKCKEASRALQLRSTAYPIDFILINPCDVAPGQSPLPKSSGEDSNVEEGTKDAS